MAFDLTAVLRLRDEVSGKLRRIIRDLESTDRVSKSLSLTFGQATRSMTSLTSRVSQSVTDAARSFDRLSPSISNATKQARSLEAPLSNIRGILAGIGSVAGITGAKTLFDMGIGRLSTLEGSSVSLGVMMGDQREAEKFMADVLAFAKTTPFAFPELAETARNLFAFGMEQDRILKTMQAIGEAAAATGRGTEAVSQIADVFGAMQISPTIMLNEIRRLESAGVPALKILANQYGLTIDEMMDQISSGAVESTKAIDLLVDGMLNGTKGIAGETAKMAGIMEKMKDTWVGSLDTLRSAISDSMAQIIKPYKEDLQDAMKWVADQFRKLPRLARYLKPLTDALAPLGKILLTFGGTVAALFAIRGVIGLISSSLAFLASPLAIVAAAITGITIAFGEFYRHSEGFRDAVDSVVNTIKGIFYAFTGQIGSGDLLRAAGFDSEQIIAIQDRINQIKETFDKAKNTIIGFYKALTGQEGSDEHFQDAGLNIDQIIKIQEIIERVREAFEKFRTFVGAVVSYVAESFRIMWSVVGPIFSLFREAAGLVLDILRLLINSAIKPFVGEMTGSFAGAAEKGASLLEKIASAAEWLGQRIQQAADALRTLRGWLQKIEMPSWIGGITETLRPITSALPGRKRDGSHYHGLDYVPYDGYMARLHRGEAVLNRQEAEAYRNGGGSVNVTITGNTFNVRRDSDINEIARKLAIEIIRATEAGV